MHTFLKENWGTIVGLITVAFVPLVFVDRINRFTALPQLWVALLGVLLGCVCISVFGARRSTKPVLLAAAGFFFLQVVSAIPSISPSLGVVPITTDFVYVSFLLLVVTGFSESINQSLPRLVVFRGSRIGNGKDRNVDGNEWPLFPTTVVM